MIKSPLDWITNLQQAKKNWLGSVGKVITTVGTAAGAGRLGPNNAALGASLQNFGGAPRGSTFQWIKPAYAAEQTPDNFGNKSGVTYRTPEEEARLAAWNATQKQIAGTGGQSTGGQSTGSQVLGGQAGSGGGGYSGPSEQDLINQAYDAQMGGLNTLEQNLPQQAEQAKQYWTGEQAAVVPVYQQEQQTRLGELQTREGQAQQQQQLETAKVKQLLSELQNRQSAQLAYTGGYGSSTNPAMAEAFGKQAFSSMGTLGYQGQQVMNLINGEKERVKNFYSNAITTLDQKVREAKVNIQSELNDKLNNITMAKGEAGRGKAQSTLEAWQNYANNISNLNLEKTKWIQSMEVWALEKGQMLEAAQKFALQSTGGFDPSAYTFNPNQPMNTVGLGQQVNTPPVKVSKVVRNYTEEEKQLAAQLGITPDQVRGVSQGMGNYQTFT